MQLLFIGESPPNNGKYFYTGSAMTTYTRRAFEKAKQLEFLDTYKFLDYFKDAGCFLDDLSLEKGKPTGSLENEIKQLSERIAFVNPPIVVIVLKRIECDVRKAIEMSGCKPVIHALPFPGHGHQKKYIDELSQIIENLQY